MITRRDDAIIENETTEFKKTLGQLKGGIISIAAILNKHGEGELWFGVRDDGVPVGVDVGENTVRDISQAIAAHKCFSSASCAFFAQRTPPAISLRQTQKRRTQHTGKEVFFSVRDSKVEHAAMLYATKKWGKRLVMEEGHIIFQPERKINRSAPEQELPRQRQSLSR